MKIYIIILNWNKKDLTLDCLSSLEKIKIPSNFEVSILVVDNASTDGSVEAVRKYAQEHSHQFVFLPNQDSKKEKGGGRPIRTCPASAPLRREDVNLGSKQAFCGGNSHKPTITLIENETNLGYAEGNNVGMRYALKKGADFLLILNNDVDVDQDFLVQLIKVAEKDEEVGLVSPKIYFAPGYEFHKERYKKKDRGKVIWYAGGLIDWDNILSSHRGVDEVDEGQFDEVVETDFTSGSCMLVKKEVFENVGLLDKKFFMYWEDADLSQRAKKAGWQVLYAPQAKIWHKVAASSAIGGSLNDYYLIRNRLLFGLRYARLRTKIALIKDSLRILLKGRKWQKIGVVDFYLRRLGKGSYG